MTWPHAVLAVAEPGDFDVARAADRLAQQLGGGAGTLFLFLTPNLPVVDFLAAMRRRMPEARIFGASAGGVLGEGALVPYGVSALLAPPGEIEVRAVEIPTGGEQRWPELAARLSQVERVLGLHRLTEPAHEGFVLLISAGLHQSEEYVTSRVHLMLPDLPLVGGSAADTLEYKATFAIRDGEILADTNLVLVCRTGRPFVTFQHHHFAPTRERAVVTRLGESPRTVLELDGQPAAARYAELLGTDAAALAMPLASSAPFGVRIQDRWYIRSVFRIDPPALHFACAVETGTVLTLMRAGDIVASLKGWAEGLQRPLGGLLFHCMGRYLEIQGNRLGAAVDEQLRGLPVAGLNTYGEQFMGLHLNHTLTGIIFQERAA